MRISKKKRRGIGIGVGVMVLALFLFWALTMVLSVMGRINMFSDQKMLTKNIKYESEYSKLTGELNQFLTVNNFRDKAADGVTYIGDKKKGFMLSEWVAILALSNRTDTSVPLNITSPDPPTKSSSEFEQILSDRLKNTLDSSMREGTYYNLSILNITLSDGEREEDQAYSYSLLPIPIPGGKIEYVKYVKGSTDRSIKLTEVKEGGD